MTYPKAYKGVKKVFIGEILEVIASLLTVVSAVLAAVAASGQGGDGMTAALLGIATAAGVLAILGFVLQMVGLFQAGKDEYSFRTAFWTVIVIILLTITQTTLTLIPNVPSVLIRVIEVVTGIAAIFVTLFVLSGICTLADKLHDEKMYRFGRFLTWVVVILYAVTTLLGLVPVFFGNAEWANNVAAVLAVVASVSELVAYVLIFIYIGKAVKMLKK